MLFDTEIKQRELREIMRNLRSQADAGDADASARLQAIEREAGFGSVDSCLAIARVAGIRRFSGIPDDRMGTPLSIAFLYDDVAT